MLRFDDFRLDPVALQVFRGDLPLDTPPQVVQVLAYLIGHGERVVARQELLDRFWPRAGTGGDAALNTCIRRIRALLDDDADAPRYIQTRPRAGYRFIGTLAGDAAVRVSSPPPRRVVRLGLGAGLLAACVLALGGAAWGYGALTAPPPQRIAIEPVQGLCEYVLFPRFNAGLRESLVAQVSQALPAGYSVATDGASARLHARVSVRQTPQQTVAVLTLVDDAEDRLLWSGEFAAETDTEDYVPLQRRLAGQMATGLVGALE
ncbi:winged helix-turn-helix domain-containing protein [Luteimonas sp. Y-2-2-4F]|nr:winged helix-turn-helix domain-containing protein [Luteimonas sp. Y-2-2-4F]MCD9032969.1 winged helix-turn-helix domain-containing protein [Luteimonas sp. Y-2-2-4F]